MERTEIKQLFETMEERTMRILEIADFLKTVSDESMIDETGKFIYILADLLFKECDRLDIERVQLRTVCLD